MISGRGCLYSPALASSYKITIRTEDVVLFVKFASTAKSAYFFALTSVPQRLARRSEYRLFLTTHRKRRSPQRLRPKQAGVYIVRMGALSPGSVLGGTYRVVDRIGVGGMGEVYEVTHARLAGRYAVKLLLREASSNSEAFQRFRREAEITSALRHPNILQIIDFNQTEDGAPYLVMEFLEGEDLSARLARDGATSIEFANSIVEQIASALSAAHKRGVVHRDLKPQNIFLVPVDGHEHDTAKVLDFGISKVKSATKNLTLQDTVMGTPQYMAPEQALGLVDEIDHRVDQFALAVIAYEMLTGRPPFEGENHHAVLYQVVHENPRPLRINGAPDVATPFEAVIRRALSKDRTARFASIIDFAKAFSKRGGKRPPLQSRLVPKSLCRR